MTVVAQVVIVSGSTDGGTTDGGSTDGGTTRWRYLMVDYDGGTDGEAASDCCDMTGYLVVQVAASTYTFPTGSEVWAGFANLNTDVYPFTFANGRFITFTLQFQLVAMIPSIYFRFERLPHPDVEPSFNLDLLLISGEAEMNTP